VWTEACQLKSRASIWSLNAQREAQARRGLQAWAGFPADRQPRAADPAQLSRAARELPRWKTKLAFHHGLIEAVPRLPCPAPAGAAQPAATLEGSPVLLTSATAGDRDFATDRGRQTLPAWCVWAQDVPEPIWSSTPPSSASPWQPPGQEFHGWHRHEALLEADGRTLTLSFTGSPASFTSYPGARVLESGNAVAVIPISQELVTGWRAGGRSNPAGCRHSRPTARHRVLLDGTGSPVMVTPM